MLRSSLPPRLKVQYALSASYFLTGWTVLLYMAFPVIRIVTGAQPVTLPWLWAPHNEHRIPLPKLAYLGLARATGYAAVSIQQYNRMEAYIFDLGFFESVIRDYAPGRLPELPLTDSAVLHVTRADGEPLGTDEVATVQRYARAGFGNYIGFTAAWGYWVSAWVGNVAYLVLLFSTMGYFFPVFAAFTIVAFGNAVNLTDGLDGLAAGCAAIVLLAYIAIAFISRRLAAEHSTLFRQSREGLYCALTDETIELQPSDADCCQRADEVEDRRTAQPAANLAFIRCADQDQDQPVEFDTFVVMFPGEPDRGPDHRRGALTRRTGQCSVVPVNVQESMRTAGTTTRRWRGITRSSSRSTSITSSTGRERATRRGSSTTRASRTARR